MPLAAVRQDFVSLSGRHDLVVDFAGGNYADNGANFFICMGQDMLEGRRRTPLEAMRYQKDLAAGGFLLHLQNVRSVKEVWQVNSEGRTILNKRTIGYLRENYATAWGSYTRGTPVDWAVGISALVPQQDQLTSSGGGSPYTAQFTYDFEDLILSDNSVAPFYDKISLVVMPPVDIVTTIVVFGKFRHKRLSDSAGSNMNFWTERHPTVLVLAALWAHEITNRNTEGARDWIAAIDSYYDNIELDIVDEEVTAVDEIPG